MEVTTETFEREVIERSQELPVLVDFWAAWCAPCRMLGPTLERLAEDRAGEFALAKVDVEANRELAVTYQIQGIPAVKAFRNGQVVSEFVGALPAAAVSKFLDELAGPTATERLIAELQATGELPDVLAALEQDQHERALEKSPRRPSSAAPTRPRGARRTSSLPQPPRVLRSRSRASPLARGSHIRA
jgi:thioredoxin